MAIVMPEEEIAANALDARSNGPASETDGSAGFDQILAAGITGFTGGQYYQTGYTFTGVPLPKNIVILTATLNVRWNATQADSVEWMIKGVDTANHFPPAWSTSNRPGTGGVPGRPPETTAGVEWDRTGSTINTRDDSPDVSAIVQEIVNLPGWASGNSMSFIIRNDGNNVGNLEIRHRVLGDPNRIATRFNCTYRLAAGQIMRIQNG